MSGNLFTSKWFKLGITATYISCAAAFIINNNIIANSTNNDELDLTFNNSTTYNFTNPLLNDLELKERLSDVTDLLISLLDQCNFTLLNSNTSIFLKCAYSLSQ